MPRPPTQILEMLTQRIKIIGAANLAESKLAQILGIFLLIVIIIVSALLVIITREGVIHFTLTVKCLTEFNTFQALFH